MRIAALGLAGALAFGPAGADVLVSPGEVLAVVTHEWTGDGGADRAVLVAHEDAVDLYIYVSGEGPDERVLAVEARAIGWRGAMWGTQPTLEVTERGALRLTSGNDAIGRGRWTETLTILYRGSEFVIGGYTYIGRDTLDPDDTYDCDVNLFTGKGTFNGDALSVDIGGAVPVAIWGTDAAPPDSMICPQE
ncbi:MAG: hypothetical protein AAFV19_10535 [Pseudomonadota bacterium]